MRKNPTEPERRLWNALKGSRIDGHKFRRQAAIGYRIVDFFCPAKALIIEIDGDTHCAEVDIARDRRLSRATGFRIVRFTNADIMRNLDGVLMVIRTTLADSRNRWPGRHHPPAPSSEEEGES